MHRPQPASQQPAQFPPIRGSQRETPNKKSSVTLAESNSVAAATCLTSSLGFLATHLTINLIRVLSTNVRGGFTWGRLRCSRPSSPCSPRKSPASSSHSLALPESTGSECPKTSQILTHPKSLGNGEALVTDDSEACLGRGRPLNKSDLRWEQIQMTLSSRVQGWKPGEWRPHSPP